jgi:hypothetical protein
MGVFYYVLVLWRVVMKFFTAKFNTPSIRLFPLGDTHYGSPQCDVDLFKQVIEQIRRDPIAYWVGMADFIENAIIGSKSDVYTQTMNPSDQIDGVVELLEPIKDKGLFVISGNHEMRSHRLVGINPAEMIADKLGLEFMGFSCLALLEMRSRTPRGFKCYFHHNTGGGGSKGSKVNRLSALRLIVPDADAVFGAHVHDTARVPLSWYDCSYKNLIRREGCNYNIGSSLSWSGSYAEEKVYGPATPEFICVELVGATSGKEDNRKQIYSIIQKEK